MVFSILMFLFRFMPIAFLLYYLVPKKFKNFTLLCLSMVFYAWGEVRYLPIMVFSILLDYIASGGIERNRDSRVKMRLFLALSMCGNLGMLLFFKYTDFFIANLNGIFGTAIPQLGLPLPLGISFYTFQTMSYTIDVYRGKVHAERNIIDFGAFVVLFPQLIAGPIVKYTDINRELKSRRIELPMIQDGIKLFIMGLGSKVLIANNVGALWTEVQQLGFAEISSGLAWLGLLAYTLQIYFDFSGYSLMAIGLGKMLGFQFPKNFDYPYTSRSVTEFWRRWHMTMSGWFRDYLYIPLGGNRKGKGRTYFNLFIVWMATGFWHGAHWNFVLWGLFYYVVLMAEKIFLGRFLEKHRVVGHVFTILVFTLGWGLFAITDFEQLGVFFTRLFDFTGGVDVLYYLRNYGVSILIGILCSMPIFNYLEKKTQRLPLVQTAFLVLVLVMCTGYLVDATYNPFLYWNF